MSPFFDIQILLIFLSYSAHQRIHHRLARHVCPECGASFETWHIFKHHVQTTCHHESRILSIQCLLCTRKKPNADHQVWVDFSSILAHFYQRHIQLFYKCSNCPKAFFDKLQIYAHRSKMHPKSAELTADFCLLYKAPFLKGPHKLFSTREACEKRILSVIKSWKRQFQFKCFACHSYFEDSQQLSSHDTRWCQMVHGKQQDSSKVNFFL